MTNYRQGKKSDQTSELPWLVNRSLRWSVGHNIFFQQQTHYQEKQQCLNGVISLVFEHFCAQDCGDNGFNYLINLEWWRCQPGNYVFHHVINLIKLYGPDVIYDLIKKFFEEHKSNMKVLVNPIKSNLEMVSN